MLVQDGGTSEIGYRMDQMEASVAPPRLITRAPGTRRRISPGRVTGIQSPERRTSRSVSGSGAPEETRRSIRAGAESQTVTPCRARAADQAAGSGVGDGSGRTTEPP